MADYKVEVDLSNLFDNMSIENRKGFHKRVEDF